MAFWRFEVLSYLLNANYKVWIIPMNKFFTLLLIAIKFLRVVRVLKHYRPTLPHICFRYFANNPIIRKEVQTIYK